MHCAKPSHFYIYIFKQFLSKQITFQLNNEYFYNCFGRKDQLTLITTDVSSKETITR
jgi:hypothetical protein